MSCGSIGFTFGRRPRHLVAEGGRIFFGQARGRLLRFSEALARAAVAALNGMATEARATPLASKGGEQAGQTAGSGKPKRRRRKKKSAETEVLPYEVATGTMEVEGPAKASTSMAMGATLNATSNSFSASATQGMAESKPFYIVGTSVVLIGLASRTDLEGKICKVMLLALKREQKVRSCSSSTRIYGLLCSRPVGARSRERLLLLLIGAGVQCRRPFLQRERQVLSGAQGA